MLVNEFLKSITGHSNDDSKPILLHRAKRTAGPDSKSKREPRNKGLEFGTNNS
jgi:hypothetical protein